MEKESYFWNAMGRFSLYERKNQVPISREWLDILYDTINEIYGVWEAGNFVKICTHLKDCTLQEVSRALIDLKKNNFDYDQTTATEKKKISHIVQPISKYWGRSSYDDDFNSRAYQSRTQTQHVERYPSYQIGYGTENMNSFISAHFIDLTDKQKKSLSKLRPVYFAKPDLRAS